jgi:3-deoxy-D-manno-octulosonic-acid transferase
MLILNSIYNFFIHLYVLIIKLLAPFNPKAKLWIDGRKGVFESLKFQIPNQKSKIAWFHCASLGEFEQGRPVIEAFRKEFPDYKILLTFFSPSGYEVRKNYPQADFIYYLPADTPENARKFIEIMQPKIAFFVKYEFWRNYLTELENHQIPVICFSAIFRKNQLFFKSYGVFYRQLLFRFKHIFVQNQESLNLLQDIDYQQVTLAGDTRFDRVWQIAMTVMSRESLVVSNDVFKNFKQNYQVLIIGSAWEEDMKVLIPMINSEQKLKYIIAPHEIQDEEIETWKSQIHLKSIRFSEITAQTQIADFQVLIIDNIGMLSSLYQYADFAYIGGAFGKGLHNILEAATFGLPLFFGNISYKKFQEANDLIQLRGAFSIQNSAAISLIINDLTINFEKKQQISEICRNYVLENIGATEKIMSFVRSIIKF